MQNISSGTALIRRKGVILGSDYPKNFIYQILIYRDKFIVSLPIERGFENVTLGLGGLVT